MTIFLNFWAIRKKIDHRNRQPFDHPADIDFAALPLSLFSVNRLINNEVSQIFYGENQFAITPRAPNGLRALERFSDAILSKLRSLIIRLNLSSCAYVCCGSREGRCSNGNSRCYRPSAHDASLNSSSVTDNLIISQWEQICARLSTNIQPSKLSLYIICDCEDRQTADMIIAPLLTLPLLQDCGLRLAKEYDKGLQEVAKSTVLYLTRYSTPQNLPPFRFLDLPREIQLNILQHTRLVYDDETRCGQDYMRFGGYCSAQGKAPSATAPDSSLLKCFCCSSHSAFSFSCDNCESLGFPHAFFLVNRTFRYAAIEVFYSKNKFAVSMVGLDLSTSTTAQIHRNLLIIPGLERFPKYSLRFLTSLRLDFESSDLELFQPNRAGWKNWLNTVDLLSEEASLAALNLEIRLTEKVYDSAWAKSEVEAGYEQCMWETYQIFIRPLISLQRLKKFFVHLNWASSCGLPESGVPDGRQEIERKLERMVMGEEYDAWKHGKAVRIDSRMCV